MLDDPALESVSLKDSWLTIGVFDGVHRGHQQIINRLIMGAHATSSPAVVVTFWPHPATVLSRRQQKCLTTPDERAGLLSEMGVDFVITQAFDQAVADTSATDFMSRLETRLDFHHLLIGYDFALGRGREGNARRLSAIGRKLDYKVEVIPAVSDESGVISSTEIRKLVATGDVGDAADLLGHAYSLHGSVVHGDGRGRSLGFPTANIEYPPEKILPGNGIYAAWATVGGVRRAAAVNVGLRPQFHADAPKPLVEAYLLDFDEDLYSADLRLEFVARLRDESKFGSVEELVQQIQRDVGRARELLAAA